ncbi:GIY-YIG nuclease family protein [Streptomyces griseoluteus]
MVGAAGSSAVKIGTSADPEGRLRSLQTGQPVELSLLWTCDGDYERALHARFAEYRIRGEWFDLTPLGDDQVETVGRALAELRKGTTPSGS